MPMPKGGWTGNKNPRWNGGKYVTKFGYVFLKSPNHPNCDSRGYVREHVFIASKKNGRPIKPNEVVHHINGNPSDNRPENLVAMTRSKHHSLHHKGVIKPNSIKNLILGKTSKEMRNIWNTVRKHERMKPKTCFFCQKKFFRRGKKPKFCSLPCFHKSRIKH